MMKGDVPIQAGKYRVDDTSWFDIRRCDGGTVVSLCDEDMNVRYTVIIEGKTIKMKEVVHLEPPKKRRKRKPK